MLLKNLRLKCKCGILTLYYKIPYLNFNLISFIQHITIILTNSCNTRSRKLKALSIVHCLFKDQPEDGPKIGPKHVAGIII